MIPNLLLRNSGSMPDRNLCFTNAAIQILRNVPSFKTKVSEHNSGIHGDLQRILEFEGLNQTVSAHSLRVFIADITGREELKNGQQNDALEFCEYILQNLDSSIRSLFKFKSKTSFNFWMNNRPSNCNHCGRPPREVNDEHIVLKLSFPEEDRLHLYQHGIAFQALLNQYFELKEQADTLSCGNCCTHNSSSEHGPKCKPKPFVTREHITQHPKFLIVQLLRFKQTQPDNIQKIDTKVTNVQSFSIQDQSGKKTEYELISILNHEGGYFNGHYTALLKSDRWYLCNDIKKSVLSDDEVESNKNYAYIF